LKALQDRYYAVFKTTSSSYQYLIKQCNLRIPTPGQTPGPYGRELAIPDRV